MTFGHCQSKATCQCFLYYCIGTSELFHPYHHLTEYFDLYLKAYDKTARLLGLDIKRGGGPALEKIALQGDPNAFKFSVSALEPSHHSSVGRERDYDCLF